MTVKSGRGITLIAAALGMLAHLGCDQPEAPSSAAKIAPLKAPPAPSEAPPLPQAGPGPRGHRSLIADWVHEATAGLTLTEEQKARVEALHDQKPAAGACPYMAAKAEYFRALAKGVAAGALDDGAVKGAIDDVVKTKGAKYAKPLVMLSALHAILTPQQRKTVADAVRKKVAQMGEIGAGCPYLEAREGGCPFLEDHDGGGGCPYAKTHGGGRGCPHAEIPGEGGGCPHVAARGEGRGCPHAGKRGPGPLGEGRRGAMGLEALVADLDLSESQRTRVDALLKKVAEARPSEADRNAAREQKRAYYKSVFDAFEGGAFDPASLDTPPMVEKKAERLMAKAAHLRELIAILEEAQRKAVAGKLEKEADDMVRRSRGSGPPPMV